MPNGHSTDTTLKTLYNFKKIEDDDDKLIIVTAEDEGYKNGFWNEIDEPQQFSNQESSRTGAMTNIL
jgi:hypothetical protein